MKKSIDIHDNTSLTDAVNIKVSMGNSQQIQVNG